MTFVDYLEKHLPPFLASFSGTAGIYIREYSGSNYYAHKAEDIFPTASKIKTFILSSLLAKIDTKDLSLTDTVTISEHNKAGGSGIFKEFDLGARFTLKDAAYAMMIISDNTATNICIDAVGGVEEVNAHLSKNNLECTRLGGRVILEELSSQPSALGVSTPKESADFVGRLLKGEVLSSESTQIASEILFGQQCADQFPRFLPYTIYAEELGFEQSVNLAHKTGYVPSVRSDVGYIKIHGNEFLYSVFSKDCADDSMHFNNEGSIFAGRVGETLYHWVCENVPA